METLLGTWEPNRELASQHLREFEKSKGGGIGTLIESWPPTSRPNRDLAIDQLLALNDRAMRRELIAPSRSKSVVFEIYGVFSNLRSFALEFMHQGECRIVMHK